jgi:Flp pilus assembly protein TadB
MDIQDAVCLLPVVIGSRSINEKAMKTFIYYCFYRASKFYKSWGETNIYYISGRYAVVLALVSNVLTLIGLFCLFILGYGYSINVVYVVVIILAVLGILVLREKDYKRLEQRYKNEKNSKLKGWLVFFYIIGSVIFYFISSAILF